MAVVAVARACAVTMTMLSVFLLAVLTAPGVAAENQMLFLDYEVSNDAFLFTATEGYDAADALSPVNTGGAMDDSDFGYDSNYWDGSPGLVYWGNGTSASSGTYGVAYVKIGLTNLAASANNYWSVDIISYLGLFGGLLPITTDPDSWCSRSGSDTLSVSGGFGTPAGSYGWNNTPRQMGTTTGSPLETSASTGYFYNIMNDAAGRPWSTDEINAGYIILKLRFDETAWSGLTYYDTPVSLMVGYVRVQVQSETYTPPPAPTAGSFILYPDEDLFNYQWHPIPTDDLFDNLNESKYFGDGSVTYVRAAWDEYAYCRFNFEDPPDSAPAGTHYAVTAWMIAKENVTNANDRLGMSIELLRYTGEFPAPYALDTEYDSFDVTTSWYNYTIPWVRVGGDLGAATTVNWTLEELANVTGRLTMTGSDPYGGVCVTQFALLCTPVSPIPVSPIPGQWDEIGGWLADGGIRTILGIMGFLMCVGAPVIMVVRGRDQGGIEGFFFGLLILALGIGFLWAGLAGHW